MASSAAPAPSIHAALLLFHRTVGPIYREAQAKYGRFADLSTVLDAVTPPLLEAGLVLTQTLADGSNASQVLVTTLTHAGSGEQLQSSFPIPSLDQLLERNHALRLEVLH